jgi:Fe2+ or Zn2+ uptake regulation protein
MAVSGRVHLIGRLVGCLRATRKGREPGVSELNSARTDIPDVSSAGINKGAKMVWQAIQATDTFIRYGTVGRYRDTPGRYWHGAVNQVINDLWPALQDRYVTEKEQEQEIKLALNRFLKYNKAVVCTRDGGVVKPSMWFIATHWPELTVTPGPYQGAKTETNDVPVVTDAAATASPTTVGKSAVTPLDVFTLQRPAVAPVAATTEEKSEEEMTTPVFQEPVDSPTDEDEAVKHKCRLETCTLEFEGIHHRATHEMKHGFRVNEDGTATNFDVNSPTPDEEEVQALIVKVCEGQEPMNQSQIVEAVRKDTPKAGAPTIKIVLQILADDGWFEVISRVDGQKGRVRRFKYLGEPFKKVKKVKTPLAQAVEETIDKMVSTNIDENRIERYRGLIEDLMADLAEIDDLRDQIKRMEHSHELVNEELRRTIKERDKALADAGDSEELARVTKERDELQGKLDTLKQIFN